MNETAQDPLHRLARDFKAGTLDPRTVTREVWVRVKAIAEATTETPLAAAHPETRPQHAHFRGIRTRSARRG